ncbi:PHP domain-containing protein [Thermodesulfobacteriota bacterium]
MKIDLHIHSRCSDGRMNPEELFLEANKRHLALISITDHDSLDCQESAQIMAEKYRIRYLSGLELNVSYAHEAYREGKPAALDFLAYGYDIHDRPLRSKLHELREYRQQRAEKILQNVNIELKKENIPELTQQDMEVIQASVDGAFGRPHIAGYLVEKGIVATKQQAFDQYLVRCNVPKMPLSLPEASELVREAGGKLMLAHPSDPRGTSLVSFAESLPEQQELIRGTMLPYIDGVECWHHRHDLLTTASYIAFAREQGLIVTGGSDCHQSPVVMGSVDVPEHVAEQFGFNLSLPVENQQGVKE